MSELAGHIITTFIQLPVYDDSAADSRTQGYHYQGSGPLAAAGYKLPPRSRIGIIGKENRLMKMRL